MEASHGLGMARGEQLGVIPALSIFLYASNVQILYHRIISSNRIVYTKGMINTKELSGPQKHPILEGPQMLNLSVREQGSPSGLQADVAVLNML